MDYRNDRRLTKIWSRYKRTGASILRNALIEYYLPFVRQCAQRVHSRLPSSVELDDLVSAGVFGLAEAIESYEINRQVRFTTFSARRIHGSMVDELRASDWVPRKVRSDARKLESARARLEFECGRAPAEQEVAGRLGLSPQQFAKMAAEYRGTHLRSINQPLDRGQSGGAFETRIADTRAADPLSVAQRRSVRDLISRYLTRQERMIVLLYYYEQMTMAEIGITLDISESRVSQIHSLVVRRLRAQTGVFSALEDAVAA